MKQFNNYSAKKIKVYNSSYNQSLKNKPPLKIGDNVKIIRGSYKGKNGDVIDIRFDKKKCMWFIRVKDLCTQVNFVGKKHHLQGSGLVRKECFISVSKVRCI